MSRPFPDTFESLQNPLTPASSSTPTAFSYRADVNRRKTKKWLDAKPVDYGGDDWGEDEYADDPYDAPTQTAVKPTGLRQPGQAAGDGSGSAAQLPINDQKTYGDLPSGPGRNEGRMVTGPVGALGERRYSFGPDEERRAFSNPYSNPAQQSAPPQQAPPQTLPPQSTQSSTSQGPPTRFSQMEPVATPLVPRQSSVVTRKPSPTPLHIVTKEPTMTGLKKALAPTPSTASTTQPPASELQSATSAETSSDYQARNDYSPSAVPQPLTMRAPSGPQASAASSTAQFPPRKSSMSGPTSQPQGTPRATSAGRQSRSTSIGSQQRSPSSGPIQFSPVSGKALPFIRPSDIYKRMEEEKEKERQSMESSRPSMDSLVSPVGGDRSSSPGRADVPSQSGLDSSGRRRPSFEAGDKSDNRRLVPMLAPVKEQKSEYGFDGFNADDPSPPIENQTPMQLNTDARAPGLSQEETVKDRTKPTSPMLPDLSRFSGFGMDFLSQSKPENPEPSSNAAPETKAPAHIPAPISIPPQDSIIRKEPSLGFTSMVHQAFDRRDDASLPDTPASRSNSNREVGVRRSDSESTNATAGTSGISPIMSRVPSTTGARLRAAEAREGSTPAIAEEAESPLDTSTKSTGVNELSGNRSAADAPPPNFKPGHRRDFSAPLEEDNSPARTPDLGASTSTLVPQEAKIADGSDTTGSSNSRADADDGTVRPKAERLSTFRPSLPGGWVSYATNVSETTERGGDGDERELAISNPVQDAANGERGDHESTPTVGSPQPDLTPTKAAGRTPEFETRHEELPTPDPSLAPAGNPYAAAGIDPRLLSASEKAMIEDAVPHGAVASPSPDQRSQVDSLDSDDEHISPPSPLKNRSRESLGPPALLEPETSLKYEDQDRLRQEIVRSLSPRTSTAGFDGADLERTNTNESGGYRKSSYLPSEYGDYWDTTADGADDEPSGAERPESTVHKRASDILRPGSSSSKVGGVRADDTPDDLPPVRPLSIARSTQQLQVPDSRSGMPPSRYSWEGGEELNKPSSGSDDREESKEDSRISLPSQSASMVSPPSQAPSIVSPMSASNPRTSSIAELEAPLAPSVLSSAPSPEIQQADDDARNNRLSHDIHLNDKVPAADKGLRVETGGDAGSRPLSIADEKEVLTPSRPPDEEHPANSPQIYSPQVFVSPPLGSTARVTSVSSSVGPSALASPLQGGSGVGMSDESRISHFREIAALGSHEQRLSGYRKAREQFATLDTGLSEWLWDMKNRNGDYGIPELAAIPSAGAPAPAKALQGPRESQPLSQPYYQQYLNASSPPSKAGSQSQAASQQKPLQGIMEGFSSGSGTRLDREKVQAMQAKSKELLHSAGVFGGKAGKKGITAGKGLLQMGKTRLEKRMHRGGAGSGDKNTLFSNSGPSKRTSWGISARIPTSLNKSSTPKEDFARPKSPGGPAGAPEPSPVIPGNQARVRTMVPSETSSVRRDNAYNWMQGGTPSVRSLQSLEESPKSHTGAWVARQGIVDEGGEGSGIVGGGGGPLAGEGHRPEPISKYQPTWDPFNATPIDEEGVSDSGDFDEVAPTSQLSQANPDTARLGAAGVTAGRSRERSHSGERFFDAREEWGRGGEGDRERVEGVVVPLELRGELEVVGSAATATSASGNGVGGGRERQPSVTVEAVEDEDGETTRQADFPSATPRQAGFPSTMATIQPVAPPPPPTTEAREAREVASPISPTSTTQQTPIGKSHQRSGSGSSVFKGLPPIRRSSTFGFSIGQKQTKNRFPIDDDDEDMPHPPVCVNAAGLSWQLMDKGLVSPVSPVALEVNERNEKDGSAQPKALLSDAANLMSVDTDLPPPQIRASSSSPTRRLTSPTIIPVSSTPPRKLPVSPPPENETEYPRRPSLAVDTGDLQSNQESLQRLGMPTVRGSYQSQASVASLSQFPQPPSGNLPPNDFTASSPRNSGGSATASRYAAVSPSAHVRSPASQTRPYEQPPSSAQRYPGLFQVPGAADEAELPAEYYQSPLGRDEAFFPRTQSSEYQLAGVGPDERRESGGERRSRRNSWREVVERLSRGVSRERRGSVEVAGGSPARTRRNDADHVNTDSDDREGSGRDERRGSGVGEGQERESRRSSKRFSRSMLMEQLGALRRTSTSGLIGGRPASRGSANVLDSSQSPLGNSPLMHNQQSQQPIDGTPGAGPAGRKWSRPFVGLGQKLQSSSTGLGIGSGYGSGSGGADREKENKKGLFRNSTEILSHLRKDSGNVKDTTGIAGNAGNAPDVADPQKPKKNRFSGLAGKAENLKGNMAGRIGRLRGKSIGQEAALNPPGSAGGSSFGNARGGEAGESLREQIERVMREPPLATPPVMHDEGGPPSPRTRSRGNSNANHFNANEALGSPNMPASASYPPQSPGQAQGATQAQAPDSPAAAARHNRNRSNSATKMISGLLRGRRSSSQLRRGSADANANTTIPSSSQQTQQTQQSASSAPPQSAPPTSAWNQKQSKTSGLMQRLQHASRGSQDQGQREENSNAPPVSYNARHGDEERGRATAFGAREAREAEAEGGHGWKLPSPYHGSSSPLDLGMGGPAGGISYNAPSPLQYQASRPGGFYEFAHSPTPAYSSTLPAVPVHRKNVPAENGQRSPGADENGQQRPYQLQLPGDLTRGLSGISRVGRERGDGVGGDEVGPPPPPKSPRHFREGSGGSEMGGGKGVGNVPGNGERRDR